MPVTAVPTILDALADRAALTDLATSLGRWLDEKRFDASADLFTEDAHVTTPGGTAEGIAALTAQAARNHTAAHTQHVITDVLTAVDGDVATITANLTVTFVPDAGAPEAHRTLGERYALGARRTGAGWRLTSVRVVPLWRRDEHLRR